MWSKLVCLLDTINHQRAKSVKGSQETVSYRATGDKKMGKVMIDPVADNLLRLSHEIGREERGLAVLGEGNTSARFAEDSYLVKASGTSLGNLRRDDLVECRLSSVLSLLDMNGLSDAEIDAALLDARVDAEAKKPSVESVFHAWALSMPGIQFVGHSHATAVTSVLCSPRAKEFAEHRMFPDEIVCGGVASVYIPLTDPGLKLAQAIRREAGAFIVKHQCVPQVILMQNHGIITLGGSWQSVLAAMLMTEKAAKIFIGAAQLGGPVFLSDATVNRIAGRPDEIYRQRALNM
jgi:rhamnose utilization protein RhaD (predicted bifunctional aldolase and dehydrogenase)